MSENDANIAQRRHLRDVFGQYATGVTVVTACDDQGHRAGITVNSFSSVSLEPPLILWCLGREAAVADIFVGASHFAVNVLDADQEALALLFAERREDKFEQVEGVTAGIGQAPLLPGGVATLQCATHAAYDGGDHLILVGKVLEAQARPGDALLFHRGRFSRTTGV